MFSPFSCIFYRFLRARFPDALIYPLLGRRDPPEPERHRLPECGKAAPDQDKAFYLVEQGENRLFVTVTDSFVEILPIEKFPEDNLFTMDGWLFIKCNCL